MKGIKLLDDLKVKPMSSQGYLILAEFYANTGRRIKALVYLIKARKMFKKMGMDFWLAASKQVSRNWRECLYIVCCCIETGFKDTAT